MPLIGRSAWWPPAPGWWILALFLAGRAAGATYLLPPAEFDLVGSTRVVHAHREDTLLDIGRRMGVPAFFKLMPRMSHYYAMKNEFQSITKDLQNIQVSTVQWDVKDGPRFDIGFTDTDGAYLFNNVRPNYPAGEPYSLRFTAPGAGPLTAVMASIA